MTCEPQWPTKFPSYIVMSNMLNRVPTHKKVGTIAREGGESGVKAKRRGEGTAPVMADLQRLYDNITYKSYLLALFLP